MFKTSPGDFLLHAGVVSRAGICKGGLRVQNSTSVYKAIEAFSNVRRKREDKQDEANHNNDHLSLEARSSVASGHA